MKPDRMRRVDEAVREVLGDVIQRELKDPRVGFATVTQVRTSADLRHAKVLVSVLPDIGEAPDDDSTASRGPDTIDGLRSAHGFLQRRVADELHLRNTPTLTFELDETVDRALRIQGILEDPDLQPSEDGVPVPGAPDAAATGDEDGAEDTTVAPDAPDAEDAPR